MSFDRAGAGPRPSKRASRGSTRQRMVDAAVALLRERSSAAVTVDAVLERSGAPRGSVYHHFPDGRDQIVREAVQSAGEHIAGLIDAAGGADAVIERFLGFWGRLLRRSDYLAGCPVVALTIDSHPARSAEAELVRGVFASWHERLRGAIEADGVAPDRARRLATVVLAATEGAILLSRAQRSCVPLDDVGAEMRSLLGSARSTPAPALLDASGRS